MGDFDEHKVRGRLEASRRARKSWRDSDTYLNILLAVSGLFAVLTLGFILLALFL